MVTVLWLQQRPKYVSPLEHRVTSTAVEPPYAEPVDKYFDSVAEVDVWLREGRAQIYILKPDGTYEKRLLEKVNMVKTAEKKHEVAATYDILAFTVLDDVECPLIIKPPVGIGALFTVHYHCGWEPLAREVVCSLDVWLSRRLRRR